MFNLVSSVLTLLALSCAQKQVNAYSASSVPRAISEKFLEANTEKDTMLYIYNSLASSGTQACNAIIQTVLSDDKLEESQLQAMEKVWSVHCSQMNKHLDTTSSLVFPTLNKSGLNFSQDKIAEAQKKLRDTMSSADKTIKGLVSDDKSTSAMGSVVKYQKALMDLLYLQNEEIMVGAKSSVDKKVWDKMNKEFMSQGGDMGSFIHFMGVDEFRNGWGKGQPGFLWNLVFSKNLKDFEVAFGEPMEILEKAFNGQETLDLSFTPTLHTPTPSTSINMVDAVTEPAASTVKKEDESSDSETAAEPAATIVQDEESVQPNQSSEAVVYKKRKRDMIRNLFKRHRRKTVDA